MDINKHLIKFSQGLVLGRTTTEKAGIDTSLNRLKATIDKELGSGIEEQLVFGSYTRNTILPRNYDPNSDVDLMVIFDTESKEFTPDTYRRRLYDVLSKNYPNSIIKKAFPVVKLELNHIMFDVIPAKRTNSWWSGESIYIPDRNNDWQETDPNDINDRLSEVNQKYGDNNVRNIIRLCKHWNAGFGYPFESYLMEKELIELNYNNEDTYSGFLYALDKIADDLSGVNQALNYINDYIDRGDYKKQILWLRKLLPLLPEA
jgi:predicted nucleotidyltransferase